MELEDLNKWVDAYIEVHGSGNSTNEDHPCYWAVEKFADLEMDYPHPGWEAMLQIIAKPSAPTVISSLASGPLEEGRATRRRVYRQH